MARDNRYNASSHFVWRQELSDILGEGAFGTVFKGMHKESGESVAVKTFNRTNGHRVSQSRELDIISRLDHPNIVRLIAIEEVLRPRRSDAGVLPYGLSDSMQGKVLIIELCSEESLYINLDRPTNAFGLEEWEFLLVLAHMTAGLRYLHENKIIHRDWKPSNILKTVTSDGETVYKLCDFGAARVCEETGQFMSIVGTEEYLNPEIYRRALLGGSNGTFSATSDLWSIGATLYQTATSLLPFRPYGGRKNREVMHKMMTEKESGVISGHQDFENGPIHYKKDLPAHCWLSSGLRPLVKKILAGLLESKQSLCWNYERYFHEVAKILSKVSIKFYVLGESNFRTIYLDRTADYFAFRDEIAAQLPPSCNDYAMIMGLTLLEADNWEMNDFLQEQKSTIIVVPLNDPSYQQGRLGIPLTPQFIEHEPPSLDWDTATAKDCVSAAHWIYKQLMIRRAIQDDVINAASEIRTRLAQEYNAVGHQWSPWKFSWSVVQRQLKIIDKLYTSASAREILTAKHSSACQITQAMSSQEKDMLNLKSKCMEFTKLVVPSSAPEVEKREILAMEKTLGKMETIFTQFRKDKAMRLDQNPESYLNELKWHGLQKKQLKTHWQWCKEKYSEAEEDRFRLFIHNASTYFRAASQLGKSITKMEIGVRNMEEIIRAFEASLEKLPTEPQAPKENGEASSKVTEQPRASTSVDNSLQSLKVADQFLSMVKDIQEMRGVAQENRQLMERFPAKP